MMDFAIGIMFVVCCAIRRKENKAGGAEGRKNHDVNRRDCSRQNSKL